MRSIYLQATIFAHHQHILTVPKIVTIVNHSSGSVSCVVKRGRVVSGSRRRGPKSLIPKHARQLLLCKNESNFYARKVSYGYAPMLKVRSIQQLLAADSDLLYLRMRKN